MQPKPRIRPFLKWAGNKYRCLNSILGHLTPGLRLIEPFAGSCAITLNTDFPENICADQNKDLINLYQQLRDLGQDFIEECRLWFQAENNQAASYYQLRSHFNQSSDEKERAGLFLYLNRHGFNGLCRFNQQGRFNVPFGRYTKPYFPEHELYLFWKKVQKTDFLHLTYEESFSLAKKNDVIYCDPPYMPLSNTANFTSYTKQAFGQKQQVELAELAQQTAKQGIDVFISNHDTATTRNLYQNATKIYSFPVQRSISANGGKRIKVQELLAYFAKPSR